MLAKVLKSRTEKSIDVSVYRFLPSFNCDLLCKFHEAKFSANLQPCVFLSSFDSFRKNSPTTTNMLDTEEGSFDPRSVSPFLEHHGSFYYNYIPPREVRKRIKFDRSVNHVLYSNPRWIWCLNIPPTSPQSRVWKSTRDEFLKERRGRFLFFPVHTFDKLCMEVGKQVGLRSVKRTDWKSFYDKIPLIWCTRKILVIHGPVLYRNNRNSFINMFRSWSTRTLISCSVKDIRFSSRREYRILVCGFSSPSQRRENIVVDYASNCDIQRLIGFTFDNSRIGKLEGGVVYEGHEETLLKQLGYSLNKNVEQP